MQRHWIHAWLLLTPAFVFLLAFTHIPAITTLWQSFWSTPRGRRPSKWVGLENYQELINDPVFWKVLGNNFWFAVGTIPTSIIIALAMALWVNDSLPVTIPALGKVNLVQKRRWDHPPAASR